ncbi:MAG TPA: D-2-hydroxyacid dehydrogenase [Dehalococcoidia bacterium]|nr:D-2-hydroxyacid dehydrogenase [Dehalococcoidia bacterium]
MSEAIKLVMAMPLDDALLDRVRAVSPRVEVTALSRAQRYVYRDGRPLWGGYQEPPAPEDESEEVAREALAQILAETQVLVTNHILPDNISEMTPKLKWAQLTSAGVDALINHSLLRDKPVTVTTASGVHATTISEYIMGAMLTFAKNFRRSWRAQEEHRWQPYWPQELEDATVAIIGVGAIGRRTAELAKALRMHVLATRRSCQRRTPGAEAGEPAIDELYPPSDLHSLLAAADYIVLALPLTADSRGLIGQAELAAMKPNAVIINIARGSVIDQEALLHALKDGRIAGAALDVTTPEPLPPDHELWTLDNVMITPHISGGTPRYMARVVDLLCDNLSRYVGGEPLRNVVDVSRGY